MIYQISRENIELAKQEVLQLTKAKDFQLYDNILICEGRCNPKRLAYTNTILEKIFIDTKIPKINWEKWYKGSFCVRANRTAKEKELAGIIWKGLKKPKVNLEKPGVEFHFFFIENKIICGRKVYQREEKFQTRRPDLRPGFFPVFLKPKLARALVNLSGIKKGTIWDPFCGTGGILLEASLMGLKAVGTDIDPMMIRAAKQNFEQYECKAKISLADARKEKVACTAVVTDPPYGRRASTKKIEVEKLYNDFLRHVYPFVDKVVLMIPNNLQIKTKYTRIAEMEDYVHANLTRKILILEKKSKQEAKKTP